MAVRILLGDCRDVLRTLPDASVHCVVTSPPYLGLRDYGCDGQIGLETPAAYIAEVVSVFREVRRVLRADGTLWLNLGDSYNSVGHKKAGSGYGTTGLAGGIAQEHHPLRRENTFPGLKHKDLCGIPWRVAFALQADGWWLRQDIIWSKPNPMPESVTDRCTKAHEYLFLFAKSGEPTIWQARDTREWSHAPDRSQRLPHPTNPDETVPRWNGFSYYFDQDAILEDAADVTVERLSQPTLGNQEGSSRVPGKTNGNMKAVIRKSDSTNESFVPGATEHSGLHRAGSSRGGRASGNKNHKYVSEYEDGEGEEHRTKAGLLKIAGTAYPKRNRRSVWEVTTQPFKEAHFATFPPALIEPCILAGCPEGGTVLDCFFGAGTTGLVCDRLKRNCIGIELNPTYVEMAERRIRGDAGMFAEVGT